MQQWLERHGITYNARTDLKKYLLGKVHASKPVATYKTDVLAANLGHEVVRLPVAHCEFNPIEFAWAFVKDYCRKNNQAFTLLPSCLLLGA